METRKYLWRFIRIPPQIAYALGLGKIIGRFILLLTTTGRKSGKPRVTPLQYEEVNSMIYIGSARGMKSDWLRNILANPIVEVRVKERYFRGNARVVSDPQNIVEFLELRLSRHPYMLGLILRTQGFPAKPSRQQLEDYARGRAMVIIRPMKQTDTNEIPGAG